MEQITKSRLDQAKRILARGVIVGVLPDEASFLERLASKEPMKIYIGADPTSTSLHLSHAKNYMLLEEFRQLGHEVYVLFGDFTAQIGDPTDRLAARKQLTPADVQTNVKFWLDQIKPLMNFDDVVNPPKIVFNSTWLSKLTMVDVVKLASNVTVQRMLERDMFEKRLNEGKPIHMHEFLYPLMQGYDSVAMGVDAELCGTDQTFNALVGRTLLHNISQKDKFVVTVNLMENPKTGELMSKSRGTGVFLHSSAFDMYGSIMSQPDEMTELFFINNTRIPLADIVEILKAVNPRDAKMQAALAVTTIFHGQEEAGKAQEKFIALVQNKEITEDIPEVTVTDATRTLLQLLQQCVGSALSNTELRKLISQKAIKINSEACVDENTVFEIPTTGLTIKVGKHQWFKVVVKN